MSRRFKSPLSIAILAALILVVSLAQSSRNTTAPAGGAPSNAAPIAQVAVTTITNRGSYDGDVRRLPWVRPEARTPKVEDESPRGEIRVPGKRIPVKGAGSAPAPAPLLNFEGLDAATWSNSTPPDPHGDIGPNHYIEAINVAIGIFDKSNGTRLAAYSFDTFMSNAGMTGPCGNANSGDPYVMYDRISGRWFVTDFAWYGSGPFFECIAVSKTSDPVSGGWWTYAVQFANNNMPDYPKFGVWADGIYMTSNLFQGGDYYAGVEVDVFNRDDLISNASTIRMQSKVLDTSYWSLLPANDEFGKVPSGTPAMFISDDSGLRIWKWSINWSRASKSVWSGPFNVTGGSEYQGASYAIVQKGSSEPLDRLEDRLMSAAQWSNVNGNQSLWIARTIDASYPNAGIYWAEIRNIAGSTPTVFQDMKFGVTASNRWMPSLVVNSGGSMAMVYSYVDETIFPSLAYSGRTSGATAGTLDQGEASLATGGSAAVTGYSRWGDYFAASLDPSDDCTMWLLGEYMSGTGGWDWTTRIAKVKFGTCPEAPLNSAAPTIDADPKLGVAVSASSGTWGGSPTFTYAWYSCTNSGAATSNLPGDCTAIRNATAASFTPTTSELGKRLRVLVTATNSVDTRTYVSAASAAVAQAPSVSNTPSISGTAKYGSLLTATSGTWKATPTASYAYKWLRCTNSGAAASTLPTGCTEISLNSTSSTYTAIATDVTRFLRVRVTATNSAGSAASYSKSTSVVAGVAPFSTGAPTVSGTAKVGSLLTVNSSGTWDGAPTPSGTYTYAWYACTKSGVATASPSGCSVIRSATGSSFTPTSSQVGKYIRVRVTATNSVGNTSYYSATTSAVAL